jgi:hypothetical protein
MCASAILRHCQGNLCIRLILLAIGKESDHIAFLGGLWAATAIVGIKGIAAYTASKHGTIGLM